MRNIKEITEITHELIEYYKNNLNEAQKAYFELTTNTRGLDKSKLEGYYEKHHIIPRCMGGLDEDSNYVLLTYPEHVLAHMLLYVLNPTIFKLEYAFNALINVSERRNEKLYISLEVLEMIRKDHSKNWSNNNPTKTPEAIKKQALSISGNNNPSKRSDVRNKISEKMKGNNNPMKNPIIVNKLKKKVLDSEGNIYNSVSETLLKLNISRKEFNNKLDVGELQYIGNVRKQFQKVIDSSGRIYPSIRNCALENNVGKTTMKKWIEKHPEKGFKYLN